MLYDHRIRLKLPELHCRRCRGPVCVVDIQGRVPVPGFVIASTLGTTPMFLCRPCARLWLKPAELLPVTLHHTGAVDRIRDCGPALDWERSARLMLALGAVDLLDDLVRAGRDTAARLLNDHTRR